MSRRSNGAADRLADDPLWYQDAVIYEAHVRTFADSNGDGIGDFRGLLSKLDYLQDLGINALWLLPFYPSPLRDDGYDIADYTDIQPAYGTLADFKAFLREAHARGLRVISELVLNHTSDQHCWFQRARQAAPGTSARDFYVWSEHPDKYKDARIIFRDFESSNWTWDAQAGAYYWHRFYSHQPDLNYDHPAVARAMFEALDFWMDLGVDGVRLDAVPYLYEREGTNCENLPETHDMLRLLRRHVNEKYRNRMLLSEANQWPEQAVAYFGNGDESHMAFHFPLMPRLFMAIRMEDRFPVTDIIEQTPAIPEACQWAVFLRNHDELTLEMVTDEDRDYMYRVYARDPKSRINLGIRRRLAPLLDNHRGKIELMNGLLLSLPGTPVIYYGDEIGMGDNIYLGDRNGVRTPMQWNAERNAGFSRANPQQLCLPVIIDPEYHYHAVNVETQQNNPHSLLWWMKRLIALRKGSQAFGRGSLEFVSCSNTKVLAYLRRYRDERILVVANLSGHVQCTELDLAALTGMVPVEMSGRTRFPPITSRPYFLTLGPYAFYWFTLGPARAEPSSGGDQASLPTATLSARGEWSDIIRGEGKPALEKLLPDYLATRFWFQGTGKAIKAVSLLEAVPVPATDPSAYLTLVEFTYEADNPEMYQLALAFADAKKREELRAHFPETVICPLTIHDARTGAVREQGTLYDALSTPEFSEALVRMVAARRRHVKGAQGDLMAIPSAGWQPLLHADEAATAPVVRKDEEASVAIVHQRHWLLKSFRRVERVPNPEEEVARFLVEKTSFRNVLPLVGDLRYRPADGQPRLLSLLQKYLPNQGDAWEHTLGALGPFLEHAATRTELPSAEATGPAGLLEAAQQPTPPFVHDTIGSFLETVRLLGQRTAELHGALASHPELPVFAPEPFSLLYQRSLYQQLRTQFRQTMQLLRERRQDLSPGAAELALAVLGKETALLLRLRSIIQPLIPAQRQRCHDDYRLRRLLFTGKDFLVTGFGGDPAQPLEDRRRKHSALRDVASLLQSFQYAALVGLRQGPIRPEDKEKLRPWVRFWLHWSGATLLGAYLENARPAGFLPPKDDELRVLLDYYLIKRVTYDLRHHLTHRTQRVEMPLTALLHLG